MAASSSNFLSASSRRRPRHSVYVTDPSELPLVPIQLRIKFDPQRGRQHAGSEIFGILSSFFVCLAKRMMLGKITMHGGICWDCQADGSCNEAIRLVVTFSIINCKYDLTGT